MPEWHLSRPRNNQIMTIPAWDSLNIQASKPRPSHILARGEKQPCQPEVYHRFEPATCKFGWTRGQQAQQHGLELVRWPCRVYLLIDCLQGMLEAYVYMAAPRRISTPRRLTNQPKESAAGPLAPPAAPAVIRRHSPPAHRLMAFSSCRTCCPAGVGG